MGQYMQQPSTQDESSNDEIDNWKSTSTGIARLENTSSCGFDCNICLDTVRDPVVTFCGHLYCWPCIYRWIHSPQRAHPSQCPVCKEGVSDRTLIPLYGRDPSSSSFYGKRVPPRPNSPRCGVRTLIATTTSSHPSYQVDHHGYYPYDQVHQPYYYLAESPEVGLAGTTTFHPMIGMFGGLFSARVFGNSEAAFYTYPNTYSVATTSSARVRRRMIQADRSLSRVSFFILCAVILCLLLF